MRLILYKLVFHYNAVFICTIDMLFLCCGEPKSRYYEHEMGEWNMPYTPAVIRLHIVV